MPPNKKTPVGNVPWQFLLSQWRLWWLPFTTLLFVVGSGLLVLWPQTQGILTAFQTMEEDKKVLSVLTAKAAFLRQMAEGNLLDQAVAMQKVLPNQKPVFATLTAFDTVAQNTGVVVTQYSLTPGAVSTASAVASAKSGKPGQLSLMPVSVAVVGELTTVNDFIQHIEQTAPLMQVEKVQVSKAKGTEDQREAVLAVQVLYALPPATLPGVGQALVPLSADEQTLLTTVTTYAASASSSAELTGTGVNDAEVVGKNDLFGY